MKKSIFILAALFVATFANAQIELIHTFESSDVFVTANNPDFNKSYIPQYGYIESPYFYEKVEKDDNCFVNLYNKDDFSLYKAIPISAEHSRKNVCLTTRDILTTDGKVCFCMTNSDGGVILDEDGQQIATIKGRYPVLTRVNEKYILITVEYNQGGKTYIYSVPGNGVATDQSEVSVPRRNTRKYINNDQVLIDSNDRTYTVQGQEVK